MVVTLDAQLFYSVLDSLPYLVDYPYECTEQTLNRFLSTGIAAALYDKYPAVEAMAREMSKRETRFETWDAVDPNRKMALEETPWLELSQGGKEDLDLIKVLDPRVARAQRDQSLEKLRQAQLDSGAFPWWPGGPPSPYMTLYLLYGFAKASEFGIEVPRDMVEKGWGYLADYYRTEERPRLSDKKYGRELLVFLNYVASAYPDPSWMGKAGLTAKERKEILDDTFAHWKELSGTLQALLSLTLKRMDRPKDAQLVFGRLLDLAQTTENEGTFWAPEKHAWLWYEDTIETHAFALLAMMEVTPEDPRRHGLVQWLFLNKQLNHWHSTRATAEVIYALVHYLEKEGQLGVRESATVQVGGQTTTFTFEPDRYTGKHNQVVIPGEKMSPAASSTVVVQKDTPGLMFASATWHFSTEELPKEARGDLFGVTRRYFLRSGTGKEVTLKPLDEGTVLRPGDEVEVQLSITSRAPAEYVHLRDPRPAGLEPDGARSGYKWDPFAPGRYEGTRDSGTNFFFDWLPAGEYTLKYRLRANLAGTFRAGPATLQSMYAPEFTAYSAGNELQVAPAGR
jgi:alpha-2-macroglobulin